MSNLVQGDKSVVSQEVKKVPATLHYCEWLSEGIAEFYSKEIELTIKPVEDCVKQIQGLVDGYFDVVRYQGRNLYVNDEGLLFNKPLNPFAMSIGLHLVGTIIEVSAEYDE